MVGELNFRTKEIQLHNIETIYFGGGTPSLLSTNEINLFFEALEKITDLSTVKEITIETNPDDLSKTYLNQLKQTPINRLSIGVQSFFAQDLMWMNRAHNDQQAVDCIKNAQDTGFENITIDLIYGSPTTSHDMWTKNLALWNELSIPHLSAYCLTIEEKTALHHQVTTGKSKPVDEQHSLAQFIYLQSFCKQHNIEQYELSNFAKGGNYSLHNSNYWKGKAYIGIGPSAHSFDGINKRRWNISNNTKYSKQINENAVYWEEESLDEIDIINEHIMVKLRTIAGINRNEFEIAFGQKNTEELVAAIKQEIDRDRLKVKDDFISIGDGYLFQADDIIAGLFFEKD